MLLLPLTVRTESVRLMSRTTGVALALVLRAFLYARLTCSSSGDHQVIIKAFIMVIMAMMVVVSTL